MFVRMRRSMGVLALVGAVLGAFYWWDVSDEHHLYWQPGMPGVMAAALVALVLSGCLLLVRRFSLRSLVLVVLLAAVAGTVGQWGSQYSVQEVEFWSPIPAVQESEVVRMIQEGMVQTLVRRGDLPEWPPVIEAGRGVRGKNAGVLVLRVRPHRDHRVRGLVVALKAYVQVTQELYFWPTDDPDRKVHSVQAAVMWCGAVRERFGEAGARAVADASAKIVTDPDIRDVFLHIEESEYRAWKHIQFDDP